MELQGLFHMLDSRSILTAGNYLSKYNLYTICHVTVIWFVAPNLISREQLYIIRLASYDQFVSPSLMDCAPIGGTCWSRAFF